MPIAFNKDFKLERETKSLLHDNTMQSHLWLCRFCIYLPYDCTGVTLQSQGSHFSLVFNLVLVLPLLHRSNPSYIALQVLHPLNLGTLIHIFHNLYDLSIFCLFITHFLQNSYQNRISPKISNTQINLSINP